MSGIICIHIGGCGSALGETFYDVISHEHGLTPSGKYIGNNPVQLQRIGTYYSCGRRVYARAIVVDTDVQTKRKNVCALTPYGEIFSPENVVTLNDKGTGNNFAKGYFTDGKYLLDETLESIRKEAERCDLLQGFQICHSIGGGTGSGFTSLLLDNLPQEYPNALISTYSVVPSTTISDVVVEPLNAVLAFPHLISNSHLTYMIDNETINDINENILKPASASGFCNSNCIVAHTMAGITSSLRFPGQLNSSLRKIYTNMVPYPNLHFFAPGFSPLIPPQSKSYLKINVRSLANEVFNSRNYLSAVDFKVGKIFTLAAMFRGPCSSPLQIDQYMKKTKDKNWNMFCEWIPNNLKWAICNIAPVLIPKSVSFFCNTSGIKNLLERIEKAAGSMIRRKAYLHWYTGEGMDEKDFLEALEIVKELMIEYRKSGDTKYSTKSFKEYCKDAKRG